jgi:hypothetical protein
VYEEIVMAKFRFAIAIALLVVSSACFAQASLALKDGNDSLRGWVLDKEGPFFSRHSLQPG